MAVEQTVDEVQIAGPAAAGTNGEFTGQVRFGAGRESCNLLVPDVNPLDLALPPQRVGEAVEAIADNAIDPLDARCSQGLGELVGDCLCHLPSPSAYKCAELLGPSFSYRCGLQNISSISPPPIRANYRWSGATIKLPFRKLNLNLWWRRSLLHFVVIKKMPGRSVRPAKTALQLVKHGKDQTQG